MEQKHENDADGNPAGGVSTGAGIKINWQDGPLGRGTERKEPNGAFVEGVLIAAKGRLEYYQGSKFASAFNATAIARIDDALAALRERTANREGRKVEGTHAV